ncbi:endolytic transglycosylase MltG [Nonomuraea maritima]|uniref:endolytic transglycosylase MltG n=1 Tax=Nonomuraea maritima TaxID=683260 RepID=UPI00371E126F
MNRPPDDAPEYDDAGDMIPFLDDPEPAAGAAPSRDGDHRTEPAPAGVAGAADGGRFSDGPGTADPGPHPGLADAVPGPAESGQGGDESGRGPVEHASGQGREGAAGREGRADVHAEGSTERDEPGQAAHGSGTAGQTPDGSPSGAGGVPAAGEAQASEGRRRAVRQVGLLAAGVLVGALALGVGAVVWLKPYLSPEDFEGTGSGAVTVRITPGSSAASIGSTLEKAGVVASAESFVEATEARSVSDRLRPGHYRLRKGMAATAALDLLLAPASRVVTRVTVPEGLRVSEVLPRVAKATGIPLAELQGVDKELVGLPSYAKGLEGFLFPATYEVEPGDTAVDVLAAMVERFRQAARHVRLEERAKQVNLTPFEAVTVASLIQAEGGTDDDYPKIARVIYNRLAKDTPLEIDSTVLYAQNRRTLKVSEKDTKVDSPYNTYRRKGLPVGPIANPGEKALVAALNPAKGDWHWFVTTDPAHRITKFTDKESEFVRYREELNKNLGTN